MRTALPALATTALTTAALATTALIGIDEARAVDKTFETDKATIRVQTFAKGLSHPWGLAFLPDGGMLVTERGGNLRIVSPEGELSDPLDGVPEVDARNQGGLLDVALDPNFEENRLVYLSYAEPGEGGNSTAVARGELAEGDPSRLANVEVIFSQEPKLPSTAHFGSCLVFDNDGHLFVTLGERYDEEFRTQAQDLDSHLGKVVRIHPDGSVPDDNPFVGQEGALPEIWSYGHRNSQGAALHPETGVFWMHEHGPKGGDEINIPEAGKNYGWPVVSYGVNYDGTPVGTGEQTAQGMEEPIYYWTPSIGPSGMAFYTADAIPGWQGDLFIGGLAIPKLVRLEIDGQRVTAEEDLIAALGLRIRDVVQGPDGALYLLTDEPDGEILRITSAVEEPATATGQTD
ncbi:PQQ-dependent sugar dehydrogenase [Rhodospirillaceae bacterium SYSU D60014]|uniref:PQQ-dependent sugar dehydrogenase n=1 Tax=Virgifigura deserti TaxID=2268457 RepID=UPI000E66FA23